MDSTAEKSNIPWRDMAREILESDVHKEFERIRDPSVVYPDCELSLTSWFGVFIYLDSNALRLAHAEVEIGLGAKKESTTEFQEDETERERIGKVIFFKKKGEIFNWFSSVNYVIHSSPVEEIIII